MRFSFFQRKKTAKRTDFLEVDEILFDSHQLESGGLKWRDRMEKNILYKNITVSKYVIFGILALVFGRSFYLAVWQHGFFAKKAEANYIKEIWERAPRGVIYDSRLNPLVKNTSSFNLIAIPGELPRDKEAQKHIISVLAQFLKKDESEIKKQFSQIDRFSFRPVLVLEDLSHEEIVGLKSKLQELPGLNLEENFKRSYSDGLGHILGYTGRVSSADVKENQNYLLTDIIGKSGLEYQYEKVLRGEHGATLVETRAQGGKGEVIGRVPASSGENLVLFLDFDLQEKLTNVIGNMLASSGFSSGAAVAIDPRNGGILAMQSFPIFDGNVFSSRVGAEEYGKLFNNKTRPLFNRAIAGLYPPGSTIKPFIGTAALQEKIIDEKTTVNDIGSIMAGNQEFRGWKPLGVVDIYKAIAMSSNIFFYSVGGGYGNIAGLGPVKIGEYLKKFGFDSSSGIDLPGEGNGFIPSPEWKRMSKREGWFIGDTYNMSIGQGFLQVTPLGLAVATASIANNGALLKPRMVKSIIDKNGEVIKNMEPEILSKNFVDAGALNIIRNAMHETVTSGSAASLSNLPGSAGGKTGTAQTGRGTDTHAWFTVFAPFENPKIVLTVLVENGGEGSSVAVPIARDVLEWYLNR